MRVNTSIADNAVIVGADAAEADRLRGLGSRFLRLHGYPAEKVAERIVDALVKNKAVVPITPEAHVPYALSRISPGTLRLLARLKPRTR
jgi:hypothetical protein